MSSAHLWASRFRESLDELALRFSSSIREDGQMAREDIAGSIAHAEMLGAQGILPSEDVSAIVTGLREIERELEAGEFVLTDDMEDVHLAIERRLTEKIGPAGGRLHTARSRNDQVATDERLWMRGAVGRITSRIAELQAVLVDRAREHADIVMPGYTHTQRAQPVFLAQHLLAYVSMLERDAGRFTDAMRRANLSPLGAAALAGTTFPIDRHATAAALGFDGIVENTLDAVSDRDYFIELAAACSILMMHCSRLAEEIVLWSTTEFNFVEVADAYATGSSIMPQKKNPDMAELVRGRTGRVYGSLISLLTTMKALPLAYNRDMQEDKRPVLDAVETVELSLEVMAGMIATLRFNTERMEAEAEGGFSTATQMADYLVRKGLPFREAHGVVGAVVRECIDRGVTLSDLDLPTLRGFSDAFDADVHASMGARPKG